MKTYTIKPLEWKRQKSDVWCTDTVFGLMTVCCRGAGVSYWEYHFGDDDAAYHRCDSIEDGKAKAEAFYRERLLTALSEEPSR